MNTLVGLYCVHCFITIGLLPLAQSPYPVDYIKAESLGLYCAIASMIAILGTLLGSHLASEIEKSMGIDAVFYIYGSVIMIIVVILCFGLRDRQGPGMRQSVQS